MVSIGKFKTKITDRYGKSVNIHGQKTENIIIIYDGKFSDGDIIHVVKELKFKI
jgi:hypothetical protein